MAPTVPMMTHQFQKPAVKSLMIAPLAPEDAAGPASSGSANGAFAASSNAFRRPRLYAQTTIPMKMTKLKTVVTMLTML